MSLKVHPIVATLVIAGVLILIFSLFRGCRQSQKQISQYNKVDSLNRELKKVIADDKLRAESSNKQFIDSLDFAYGQYALVEAQKLRTESELQDITKENKELIAKYKLGKYTDTSSVTVPGEFVSDCQGCFVNLEKTNGVVNRYKNDINNLQNKWDKQTEIYQNRFKELDVEKLGFYNKIETLTKAKQEAIDKLKPHGRLYLSWGVLWKPLPWAAGIGAMYQTKRNLIIGAKGYYSSSGTLIETTINFPLSLKFR